MELEIKTTHLNIETKAEKPQQLPTGWEQSYWAEGEQVSEKLWFAIFQALDPEFYLVNGNIFFWKEALK